MARLRGSRRRHARGASDVGPGTRDRGSRCRAPHARGPPPRAARRPPLRRRVRDPVLHGERRRRDRRARGARRVRHRATAGARRGYGAPARAASRPDRRHAPAGAGLRDGRGTGHAGARGPVDDQRLRGRDDRGSRGAVGRTTAWGAGSGGGGGGGGGGGPRARLVDWDKVGVGPFSYDLSTFLFRFPPAERPWVLEYYRKAVTRAGWRLAPARELQLLFDTAERARYANRLIWPALALLQERADWGFPELAEVERWFQALDAAGSSEPVPSEVAP